MKRRTLLRVAILATLVAGCGIGWAVAALRGADLRWLQVCTHTTKQPLAWACRQGLYRLHPTRQEIVELNAIAGAVFPLYLDDEVEARRVLRHYVGAGIGIDAPDLRHEVQWTALHYAVAECSARNVRLLLEAGAKPEVRDARGSWHPTPCPRNGSSSGAPTGCGGSGRRR
jgi:hypothetical protein